MLLSYDKKAPTVVVTNEHVLRNKSIFVTVPADSNLVSYMNKNNSKFLA